VPVVFDTAAFEASFAKLRSELHEESRKEWARTADEARKWMIGNGYRDHGGELSRSMYSKVYEEGYCNFRADVVAAADHALWVDQPTKGHWIPKGKTDAAADRRRTMYAAYQEEEGGPNVYLRNKRGTGVKAKRHKMLRWFVGGKPVFARRVWIPPWRGAHFTDRMGEYYADMFPVNLQQTIDTAVRASDG